MPDGLTVQVFAPAKINLTLHVTGQRADGYHLLDSLVVFADVGDTLTLQKADLCAMVVEGPEARALPPDAENLVQKIARLADFSNGISFRLNKQLPVSSGIGGGSADAAAAFRGLVWLENAIARGVNASYRMSDFSHAPNAKKLITLGADIPVCLQSHSMRMRGVGENLSLLAGFPDLHAVLANPRVAVSTPAVFGALTSRTNASMSEEVPKFQDARACIDWLSLQRNDLELPAMSMSPEIQETLNILRATPGCLLARMSGSGATCFGLYDNKETAIAAARHVSQIYPDWWVKPTKLGSMSDSAMPQFM